MFDCIWNIKLWFTWFLLIFLTNSSFAQNSQNKVDSVKLKILKQNYAEDTLLIKDILKVAAHYNRKDKDSLEQYARFALRLSKDKEYPHGILFSHIILGANHWHNKEFDLYKNQMKICISDLRKVNNSEEKIIYAKNRIAIALKNQTKLDSAEILFRQNFKESSDINDNKGLIKSIIQLGKIKQSLNAMDSAFYYYNIGDSICKNLNENNNDCIAIISALGRIFSEDEDSEKSIEYYTRAQQLYKEKKNWYSYNEMKLNIGEQLWLNKDYDLAREMTESAYLFYKTNTYYELYIRSCRLLGNINMHLEQYEKSLDYFKEAESLNKKYPSNNYYYEIPLGIGNVYLNRNDLEAIKYYKISLNELQKYGPNNLFYKKLITNNLAVAYRNIGNYERAYFYSEKNISIVDSLNEIKVKQNIRELEKKYETRKKEQEIALLTSQKQLAEQQQKNQRNLLLAALLIAASIGSIFFILYKNRKTNQKLRELDTFKSKMFTNLSHDFRTPLTVIEGLSNSIEHSMTNYSDIEKVQLIRKNAALLNEQLKQILAISALEKSNIKLNPVQDDVLAFIKRLSQLFSSYAISRGQTLNFQSNIEAVIMDFDPDKIQSIIQNLISNALKFNKKRGTITVRVDQQSDELILQVADTGIGIEKENLNKIFNRFYTTSTETNTQGSGIGLAYVKELVELMNGKISVNSQLEEGTTFIIHLPISKSANVPEKNIEPKLPFVYRAQKENEEEFVNSTKNEIVKGRKSILVVEDNYDIQTYYKDLLKSSLNVYQAFDGKEGIELLNKKEIDIIISDLSMAEMNGFEFSKQVKQIPELSHIPLIIVSANVTTEAKTIGYKIGIDAYLTKPFKEKELLGIINNLFEKQKKRNQYFSSLLELKSAPVDQEIKTSEINFVKKLQEIALENKIYSTEEIANKMMMSRSKLNQKVKSLTGYSIANYIKLIKMEKAKDLLDKSNLQISEISYQLGYEDPSLFSKVFKTIEGLSPNQYRNKKS